MKKVLLVAILFTLVKTSSAQYDSQNISLLSVFDDPTVVGEPVYGIRYQSCWGWADTSTHKEYGVIGSSAGTYIVEVTNPSLPVERDYVPTHQIDLIWHEYKTYGKYLYIISDGPANNQLQICDMSYLPDSVHVVYDSDSLLSRAHTITIEGNKMYLASVSSSSGYRNMQVYSLINPESPVLLRSLNQDYPALSVVHDMYVTNDTVYASCGNQKLHVYTYDSIANHFTEIGSLTTYPESGYNHSSVLSEDHTTLYMCDETTGKAVKVIDVTDIANMVVDTIFRSHVGAIAHNPYVKGNYLYIAYYLDGVYVYDISTPSVPVLTAFFDTYYQNGTSFPANTYSGCWGVYTGLPSGTLLASDTQNGLFCLQHVTGVNPVKTASLETMLAYPNPAKDVITVRLKNVHDATVRVEVADAFGKVISQADYQVSASGEAKIPMDHVLPGIYFIKAKAGDQLYVSKVNIRN